MRSNYYLSAFAAMIFSLGVLTLVSCGSDDEEDNVRREETPVTPPDDGKEAVEVGENVEVFFARAKVYGFVNNETDRTKEHGVVYGTENDISRLAATGKKVQASWYDEGTDNRRFSVYLTGLELATTYYFYAYVGDKKSSKLQSFTTRTIKDTERMAVDLGLPSGTKWANMNVGATKPEEYGKYFPWGESVGYSLSERYTFSWAKYKWNNGSGYVSKYCTDEQFGDVDGQRILELDDDAAYVNWGEDWCMPTREQCKELIANCDKEWITLNGVNGKVYVSKTNDNAIFFPAGDLRKYGYTTSVGKFGFYWSSTVYEDSQFYAFSLDFAENSTTADNGAWRYFGLNVRPVRRK